MQHSQLLILGNGFDVHCGLKSSYYDFFESVILDEKTEQSGLPKIRQDCTGFWESLLFEYYKYNKNNNNNWCAIENIIKDTLFLTFVDDKGVLGGYSARGIWRSALDTVHYRRDPEEDAKIIASPIHKYIFLYCASFLYDINDNSQLAKKHDLLLKHFLQSLYRLERRFCEYLKGTILNPQNGKELNEQYIVNAFNLIAKMTNFTNKTFKNLKDIISSKTVEISEKKDSHTEIISYKDKNFLSNDFNRFQDIHILSFNYTALFNLLEVECPWEYNNVHGKLCNKHCVEGCESSNIIFGIDDTLIQSQSEYIDFRLFSKTYRKMIDSAVPTNILPLNSGKRIEIKFYGHSLNEADYSYFQSIFDYYNLYGNSNVSLTFFYSNGFEQTDAIYQLINSYGKTLINLSQGKNLMHKLLLENRLNIKEIH